MANKGSFEFDLVDCVFISLESCMLDQLEKPACPTQDQIWGQLEVKLLEYLGKTCKLTGLLERLECLLRGMIILLGIRSYICQIYFLILLLFSITFWAHILLAHQLVKVMSFNNLLRPGCMTLGQICARWISDVPNNLGPCRRPNSLFMAATVSTNPLWIFFDVVFPIPFQVDLPFSYCSNFRNYIFSYNRIMGYGETFFLFHETHFRSIWVHYDNTAYVQKQQ